MAAILDLLENESFPLDDLDGVLCVVLNTSTESNYVEKHLLTFLSINILAFVHLKNANFTLLYKTLTLKMTLV